MSRTLTQQINFINQIVKHVDPFTSVSVTPTFITVKSIHKEGTLAFNLEAAAIKRAIAITGNDMVIHEQAK